MKTKDIIAVGRVQMKNMPENFKFAEETTV